MADEYTMRTFDTDLAQLHELVIKMLDSADGQLARAMESLIKQNQIQAGQTVRADKGINELQRQVDVQYLKMLALRQPVAVDLRKIVAAGKMAIDLERIADYAANIAQNGIRLDKPGRDQSKRFAYHSKMTEIVHEMLLQIKEAYQNNDAEAACRIWIKDREIDDLYSMVINTIKSEGTSDPDAQADAMIVLQVGRALERIGDHITNLAEHLYFSVTGKTEINLADCE